MGGQLPPDLEEFAGRFPEVRMALEQAMSEQRLRAEELRSMFTDTKTRETCRARFNQRGFFINPIPGSKT